MCCRALLQFVTLAQHGGSEEHHRCSDVSLWKTNKTKTVFFRAQGLSKQEPGPLWTPCIHRQGYDVFYPTWFTCCTESGFKCSMFYVCTCLPVTCYGFRVQRWGSVDNELKKNLLRAQSSPGPFTNDLYPAPHRLDPGSPGPRRAPGEGLSETGMK